MAWDILLTFTLACVIYIQYVTIKSHKRNIFILAKKIRENSATPQQDTKNWQPKIIEGELDMFHNGKRASIKAVFYPKKVI